MKAKGLKKVAAELLKEAGIARGQRAVGSRQRAAGRWPSPGPTNSHSGKNFDGNKIFKEHVHKWSVVSFQRSLEAKDFYIKVLCICLKSHGLPGARGQK